MTWSYGLPSNSSIMALPSHFAVDHSAFPIHSSSSSGFLSHLCFLPLRFPHSTFLSHLMHFLINSITFLKTFSLLIPFLVPWLNPTLHINTKTHKSEIGCEHYREHVVILFQSVFAEYDFSKKKYSEIIGPNASDHMFFKNRLPQQP